MNCWGRCLYGERIGLARLWKSSHQGLTHNFKAVYYHFLLDVKNYIF